MFNNCTEIANALGGALEADASVRKAAEITLIRLKRSPGYSLLLVQLVENPETSSHIAHAASVALKNYIKTNWSKEKCEVEITEKERKELRIKVVDLMYGLTGGPRMQFLQAVCEIGKLDFPNDWPELLFAFRDIIERKDGSKMETTLALMDELFKHYRYANRTDELWTGLLQILRNIAGQLNDLFVYLLNNKVNENNTTEYDKWLRIMHLIVEIYFSLTSQDLPEVFEDSLDGWMQGFCYLLNIDSNNAISALSDHNEASPLEKAKSCICDIVTMFSQKYDDVMKPFIKGFIEVVWQLLVNLDQSVRSDNLFHSAVGLISAICIKPYYSTIFEVQGVLDAISESIVLKNLVLRTYDIEQFEDEPTEFIKRDVQGFEMGTRRRSASDLLRALCKHFETQVTGILSKFVVTFLQECLANPQENWMKKDVIYCLISSVAVKTETAKLGAIDISDFVNVMDFFKDHVACDLMDVNVNSLAMLKCDSLKYVVTFRNHLSPECILEAVSAILRFLTSKYVSLHLYSAYALDKLLSLENKQTNKPLLNAENIPVRNLIIALFNTLDLFPAANNSPFVMMAIMRCFAIIDDETAKQSGDIVNKIGSVIAASLNANVDPIHSHFIFECLCILIRRAYFLVDGGIDNYVMPIVDKIITSDLLDFIPYALQVTAVLLDHANAKRLKFGSSVLDSYLPVINYILSDKFWITGNVPAALLVVEAFLRNKSDYVIANHSDDLLNVYKRLIDSKALDQYGFQLANALLRHVTPGKITEVAILEPIFVRLVDKKTSKFVKQFVFFIARYSIIRGGISLYQAMESVQNGLFTQVLKGILIDGISTISLGVTFEEKRLVCVGCANLLAETVAYIPEDIYIELVDKLATFTEKAVIIVSSRLDVINIKSSDDNREDSFCRLKNAQHKENIAADIKNFKVYLAEAILVRGENAKPGSSGVIREDSRNLLKSFMSSE